VDPSVVWVGNLAWTTTDDLLKNLFSQHGEVKSVAVTRQKRSNQSRGWGTVTFATPEQASAAVEALNGTPLEERDIEVQIRRGPRRRRRAPREPRDTNENDTTTNEDRPRRARRRRQPRAQAGEGEGDQQQQQQPRNNQRARRQESKQSGEATEEGKARRRPRARRPRNDSGRGEENNAPAEQTGDNEPKGPRRRRRRQRKNEDGAEGDTNDNEQQERRPRAERKEPEKVEVDNPDHHVYVRNLAWEVNDDDLKEFFSQCGTVTEAKVTLNSKNTSRGWGTVEMSSAEEAQKALGLDKQKFKERQLIVRLDKRVTSRSDKNTAE